ncbi:MAG TPA: FeoA family protein [Candidatus Cloacimonadota bacterium]|nr:FeoA family protein [Candidatus Cloacimonadota bacterium]
MLSRRNQVRLRNFGRRMRGGRRVCRVCPGDCVSLSELPTGAKGRVLCNNDTKTIERGLYENSLVEVYRNEEGEPNLIVAVGDSRYVLDRRIASLIRVKTL